LFADVRDLLKNMVKSISASASRKFLNLDASERKIAFPVKSISASASRKFLNELLVGTHIPEPDIDLSFSEPKIPQVPSLLRHTHPPRVYRSQLQRAENSSTIWTGTLSTICAIDLSFSEPKIPHGGATTISLGTMRSISASASRKFLNRNHCSNRERSAMRSISASASRKFLNCRDRRAAA